MKVGDLKFFRSLIKEIKWNNFFDRTQVDEYFLIAECLLISLNFLKIKI